MQLSLVAISEHSYQPQVKDSEMSETANFSW